VTAARSPLADGPRPARGATQGPGDRDRPRTYYGAPVLKAPVWSWEIAAYLFTGGLAGASAPLAFAAGLAGNRPLARSAWLAALAGIGASPALLISDLGRPGRFLNMLRVFKVTSPMSVGTWIVSASGAAIAAGAARELLGVLPRAGAAGGGLAAALGPALSTYTAVLLADTAVPAWHEAGRDLPFVFAGSAAASAGGAALLLTPPAQAGPARRLLLLGAAGEIVAGRRLRHGLGEVGEPYRSGRSGRFLALAEALTAGGAGVVAARGRRRGPAAAGGLLVLAGALAERWGIFRAGSASAADPAYVVEPQRRRMASGGS
jgi:Polysulphide reductase, NrfD